MDVASKPESIRDRFLKLPSQIAKMPMLAAFAAIAIGATAASILPDQLSISWLLIAIISLAFLLIGFSFRWRKETVYPKFHEQTFLGIALIGVTLMGAVRYQVERKQISADCLHSLASEFPTPVVLEGTVESIPRWKPDTLRQRGAPEDDKLLSDNLWQTVFDLKVSGIRDGQDWKYDRFGLIRITSQGRCRTWLPGDRVRCLLDWQRIMPPTNPGQSDYSKRAATEGIFVRGRTDVASQIEVLPGTNRFRFDRWIGYIVSAADQAFHRYVPLGQARMASALVLGQREQAEWELQESMLATGTIHMLAISGMHIELVAISILSFGALVQWRRKVSLSVTIVLVVVYSLVAGANPPVMRAAIFVVILCLARWVGRPMQSMNVLAFAAVVLMIYKTDNLQDVGTQLSFLAVTILIFLGSNRSWILSEHDSMNDLLVATSHPVMRWFWYVVNQATQMLKVSAWVWLLTAPLTLYYFNIVSPIASLLNVLLWIPIFVSLLAGILLLLISPTLGFIPVIGPWMGAIVGYPLGIICAIGLFVVDRVVKICEQIPLSHFWLPSPSWIMVAVFYTVLLTVITFFGFEKTSRRWIASLTCVWLLLASTPLLDRWNVSPYVANQSLVPRIWSDQARQELPAWLTFIDVGHGTCVMLELPNGQVWMYDAGRMGDPSKSHLQISNVLWDRHRTRIDKVFLSHADSDHFCAIARLASRFQIGAFYTTKQAISSDSKGIEELLTKLSDWRIPIISLDSESSVDRIQNDSDTLSLEILHPDRQNVYGNDNATSMCLLLKCYGKQLLLPGDLEGPGTKKLLERPRMMIDVLMAPHHGSLSTNPDMLLTWCHPSVVTISGGSKARNPKVLEAYSAPGRQVLNTALEHAIRVGIQKDQPILTETWNGADWKTQIANE